MDRTALERLFASRWGLLVIYLVFLGLYLGASGPRVRRHSPYNHFVYQADAWLHGRLGLKGDPPNENDWARVEVLTLVDGRVVRGKFGSTGPSDRFYLTTGGNETITPEEIRERKAQRYVSFPPFPAVLFLPFVAIWKLAFNDVLFNVLWGAANPVLFFLLLRDLVRRGHSKRSLRDDLLLTAMLGAGSVYLTAAVLGQVWYTAHVVAVTLCIGYVWATLDMRKPVLAGLFLGLGFATRTPFGFTVAFFVWEAVRVSGGWRALWQALWKERRIPQGLLPVLIKAALPAAAVLSLVFLFNHARFDRIGQFGHEYLAIGWKERAERWGLLNYHFLSRNLACALVMLPKVLSTYPYVQYSRHGLSIFATSPNLAWLFGRREPNALEPGLWVAVLSAAVPTMLYYLSGYQQFGYRFSNDYIVYLLLILALGGQRFGWLFRIALVLAIGVNLFGAITYERYPNFSYEDACIFPHGCN
ncbi:MAG TPA: hypothetical protein VGG33_17295 [Polyangia bacterium]